MCDTALFGMFTPWGVVVYRIRLCGCVMCFTVRYCPDRLSGQGRIFRDKSRCGGGFAGKKKARFKTLTSRFEISQKGPPQLFKKFGFRPGLASRKEGHQSYTRDQPGALSAASMAVGGGAAHPTARVCRPTSLLAASCRGVASIPYRTGAQSLPEGSHSRIP